MTASTSTPKQPTQKKSGSIVVHGARTHNLKNVSVEIPRNQMVVITGRSGSGKSSLAFDTIYAEGQRQYIECLSIYARQFLNQLPRADVDLIEGLQPTLCLDQDNRTSSRRSTVGTVTEVYDFLRLLMARVGDIRCYQCGETIRQQTATEIRDEMLELPERTKVMILSPQVTGETGLHTDVFAKIRKERLVRVRVDGEILDIDQLSPLAPHQEHFVEAVTDRIIVREGIESRLLEAIDGAIRISDSDQVICCWQIPAGEGEPRSPWQEKRVSTRYACADCGIHYSEVEPRSFSFNSPFGACETCTGLGEFVQFDTTQTVDRTRSVNSGAVKAWLTLSPTAIKKHVGNLQPVLKEIGASLDTRLDSLDDKDWRQFLTNREKKKIGLNVLLEKELATTASEERQEDLENMLAHVTCHDCQGSRVSKQARAVYLAGKSIDEIVNLSIDEALLFMESLDLDRSNFDETQQSVAEPIVKEIRHRLKYLQKVGVGYLTLGRSANTLSGGEHQRVRLATSIGSGLNSVCFVLDEPSIGLHQRDNDRLIGAIRDLQRSGNTVIVVEHDDTMMRQADCLIDMGPGAGENGGTIVAMGTPEELIANPNSVTGPYLSGQSKIVSRAHLRPPTDRQIKIVGAQGHNLKSIDVEIPLGLFVCVTGVSGSGKSTLINQTLAPAIKRQLDLLSPPPEPHESISGYESIDKLIMVDQKPIGRTPRACPATFTGVFDEFRKLFAATKQAKQLGFGIGRFSYNSKSGWCPDCQGHGVRKLKMNFMPDQYVNCETCQGRRFNLQTLQIRFAGLTIADVLKLTIDDAIEFFDGFSKIRRILQSLSDVGLGYLLLGQSSNTLSGGEAQRIKLAKELAKTDTGNTLFVLDEPTTGLHFEDIRALIDVLERLVEKGNSLIVIEHNLDVIRSSDWIIDLGPGGGVEGGQLVATGTPEDVRKNPDSVTGQYL